MLKRASYKVEFLRRDSLLKMMFLERFLAGERRDPLAVKKVLRSCKVEKCANGTKHGIRAPRAPQERGV